MDGDEFVKLTCFEGQRTSQTLEGVYICHLCVGEEWKGSQEEEDKGGIAGKKSSCGEGASEDGILFVMDGSSLILHRFLFLSLNDSFCIPVAPRVR